MCRTASERPTLGGVTPVDVLAMMLRTDAARPRITCYDDTDGATRGERIELSAKVLANWVSKAANLLQDEWDVAPGDVVRLDLPAHWRAAYWALAVWSVGAAVRVGAGLADALVTDSPDLAAEFADAGGNAALVTLAALARRAQEAPDGVLDEAAELASHPDEFTAWQTPDPTDAALVVDGGTTPYSALVAQAGTVPLRPVGRVHLIDPDLAAFLTEALRVWAGDGSLVLTRGELEADARAGRERAEGVTQS